MWTCPTLPRRSGAPCGRTRTWCWWGKCATWKPSTRRSPRRKTGHLVFGTLHTTGAAKTIDRVINAFPSNQQEQIRIQLSTVLQAVISQLLLPRCDKPGRVAVFEVMINTPSVSALIRDNKTFRVNSDIQTGAKYGMVTLDGFLMETYIAGKISREEVITKCQDPSTVQAKLQEYELAQALQAGQKGKA